MAKQKVSKVKKQARRATKPETEETSEGKEAKKRKAKDIQPDPTARGSLDALAQEHIEIHNSRWILRADEFGIFDKYRFYTGVVDLDVVLLPTIGSRICLVGDESTGKTLISYILEGAAHRTCRWCCTPIIEWTDPKTGEIKRLCQCGKNDPMIVLRIETEDSFDPAWSSKWGVPVIGDYDTQEGFKMSRNKENNYWVAVPTLGNAAYDFADAAIRKGAVDLVTIDSIAMLHESASVETENNRIGAHAKMTISGARKLERAQIDAKNNFGARVTCVWTTQYYMGPTRNPRSDPRVMVGGKRIRYVENQVLKIKACNTEYNKGVQDHGARYVDINFEIFKQKEGDVPKRRGSLRAYLDLYQTKYGILGPGNTDEGDRMFAYLKDLGYFRQIGNQYECAGRKFSKVKDIHNFLTAPDTNFMLRYLLLTERLSITGAESLKENLYAYSPWGRDPMFDLADTKKIRALRAADPVKVQGGGDQEGGGAADWVDEALEEDE